MSGESLPAVTAYVRPSLVHSPLDDRLAALERLADEGRIESLEVLPWPAEVPYREEPVTDGFLETYHRFRDWAADAGVELHPPFERRHVSSMFTGESTRLLLPAFCLAVSTDGDLAGVYPHGTGRDHVSAEDAIARLQRGGGAADERSPSAASGDAPRVP